MPCCCTFLANDTDDMGWLVAVHIGAGRYGERDEAKYLALMKEALAHGEALLKDADGIDSSSNSADSPTAASRAALVATRMLAVFERSELTNAGRGANLTESGHVECEASVVCGKSRLVTACASVRGVAEPSALAHALLHQAAACEQAQDGDRQDPNTTTSSSFGFSHGRQAPLAVVGEHARILAREFGIETVQRDDELDAFQVGDSFAAS